MIIVLLCIIIGLLIYLIFQQQKEKEPMDKERHMNYQTVLPMYKNKNCEITLKKPLFSIDMIYAYKGILIDMDDEWIMLKKIEKKKEVIKVIRISNISGIKEIIV